MTDTLEATQQPETLNRAIADLGLTVETVFVPAAKGTPDKDLRLNWRARVLVKGRLVLETSYTQGVGHCPAYKAPVHVLGNRDSVMRWAALRRECEEGNGLASPTAAGILCCLALDASAINSATYEDWAAEFGYDPDSREGERVYRACLEIGLKLRAALGEAGLAKLRDATQDY